MKYITLFSLGLALTLPLQAGNHKNLDAPKGKHTPRANFKKMDKDHDGLLTRSEFRPHAKNTAKADATFARKDKNSDSNLTFAEFTHKKGKAANQGKKGKCDKRGRKTK